MKKGTQERHRPTHKNMKTPNVDVWCVINKYAMYPIIPIAIAIRITKRAM